jgi:uncharacterized NAD(P)/FAD-binding protein YdhS
MAEVVPFPAAMSDGPAPADEGRGCRIAVIGAGFSGALVTAHLLWRCRPGERVYLVERSGNIGQGLAYNTPNPNHLLNVRRENMSAFSDEPDHFSRWIDRLPPERRAAAVVSTHAGTFVRRGVYGEYVSNLLNDSISRLGGAPHLYVVPDEATALRPRCSGLELDTCLGRTHRVDAAVLALGNFPPDARQHDGYFGNPWDPAATQDLQPDRPVLLIGTGLTMLDVCLDLLANGFRGPIIALSRRGLLPQSHTSVTAWPDLRLSAEDRRSLATLTAAVRREVRRAAACGVEWRAVMDAIRPHVQLLWQELRLADRQRFIRHLRPYWDVHRHRIAPAVADAIAEARRYGQLQVVAGRILSSNTVAPDQIAVHWRARREDAPREFTVQRIINCSGPGTDLARSQDPLVRQLVADGVVRPDPCRLGLDATPLGALLDRNGLASPCLYGVGPVLRGTLWEITSVPDIREQAERVAITVLGAARRAALAA